MTGTQQPPIVHLDAQQRLAELLKRRPSLDGSMRDGYCAEDIDECFPDLMKATGLHLLCLWDYHDGDFGGDSDWFILSADGHLWFLAGNVWQYFNRTDPAASEDLADPSGWIGNPSGMWAADLSHTSRAHNYAHYRH